MVEDADDDEAMVMNVALFAATATGKEACRLYAAADDDEALPPRCR